MGVTIHFEGRLKSAQDQNEVLRKGHELAKRLSQEPVLLDSGKKLLKRIRNEEDWDYEGPVKGIQFSAVRDPVTRDLLTVSLKDPPPSKPYHSSSLSLHSTHHGCSSAGLLLPK